VLVAFVLAATVSCDEPKGAAREIVDAMIERYAKAKTYADRGVESNDRGWRQSFKTAYIRSRGMRFELSQGSTSLVDLVLWIRGRRGAIVVSGRERAGVTRRRAFALAKQVSGRAPTIVPALIGSPRDRTSLLRGLTTLHVDGEEVVDQRRWWRIRGRLAEGSPITMWIENGTWVLRKVQIVTWWIEHVTTTIEYETAVVNGLVGWDEVLPPDRWWIGVALDHGGRRIARVFDDTPAKHAGLQVGDELLFVDNAPVSKHGDVTSAIQRAHGLRVFFVVRRGDEVFETSIVPVLHKRD
jgi:hypothetical protein